jgi:hypothetical protein
MKVFMFCHNVLKLNLKLIKSFVGGQGAIFKKEPLAAGAIEKII